MRKSDGVVALLCLSGVAVSLAAQDCAPYQAAVRVDLTRERVIRTGSMEKGALDRNIYFRSYYPPGVFTEERNREMLEIGAPPGRGIVVFNRKKTGDDEVNEGTTLAQDPQNPDRATAESLGQFRESYVKTFQRAAAMYPGVPFAMAGNQYPDWMCVKQAKTAKPGQLLEDWEKYFVKHEARPEVFPVCAEAVTAWFSTLKKAGCAVPQWYTIQNEPPNDWTAGTLPGLTRTVAEAMRTQHPEVKICGPCSAWPYPQTDWKVWNSTIRPFIEKAGDCIGAYDLHFYSKGMWSLPPEPQWQAKRVASPSLYEAQKLGVTTVWDYGRLDGFLDLIAAYHMQFWRAEEPRPMIISEFGRQTVHPQLGPWNNDFKPWLYMTTVIRQWMTYMERPEVELTVPFILVQSGVHYGPFRGQAIYTRPGAPGDVTPKVTRFKEFFAFFKDLQGRRVPVEVSDGNNGQWLRTRAFLDGDTVYLLVHNSKGFPRHPVTVNLQPLLGRDADGQPVTIRQAEIRRLGYSGNIPDPARDETMEGSLTIDLDYRPLEDLQAVTLAGEETAIIRLKLSAAPTLATQVTEQSYYAAETLLDISAGKRITVPVNVPADCAKVVRAQLHLGLARDGGFASSPVVEWNGQEAAAPDLAWTEGVADFHGIAVVELDPAQLKRGENILSLRFAKLPAGGSAKLVSARLVVSTEESCP